LYNITTLKKSHITRRGMENKMRLMRAKKRSTRIMIIAFTVTAVSISILVPSIIFIPKPKGDDTFNVEIKLYE
jgi:hypothetical protein